MPYIDGINVLCDIIVRESAALARTARSNAFPEKCCMHVVCALDDSCGINVSRR